MHRFLPCPLPRLLFVPGSHVPIARPSDSKARLLQSLVCFYSVGQIKPIRPTKVFSAASVQDAFLYVQNGAHLGKTVISIRDASTHSVKVGTDVVKRQVPVTLDSRAYYLIVGSLDDGLCRAVSTWMVEQGARNLLFLSKDSHGTSTEQQDFIRELRSMGCGLHLVRGSVTSEADVKRAIAVSLPGRFRGIVQISTMQRNEAFSQMCLSDWKTAVEPTVRGTWNLHRLVTDAMLELDFFVLLNSCSGSTSSSGQTNSASADAFLDAFAQWRSEKLGKPCCSVALGPIGDMDDVAASNPAGSSIMEQDVMDAMAAAVTVARGGEGETVARNQFITGLATRTPPSDSGSQVAWHRDMQMALYHL